MLAVILTTVLASSNVRGFNPRYAISDARLAKQTAKYEADKAAFDAWSVQNDKYKEKLAKYQARKISREEQLARRKARLEHLQELKALYREHRRGMETVLAEIAALNRANVVAAEKEVVAAAIAQPSALDVTAPAVMPAVQAPEPVLFGGESPAAAAVEQFITPEPAASETPLVISESTTSATPTVVDSMTSTQSDTPSVSELAAPVAAATESPTEPVATPVPTETFTATPIPVETGPAATAEPSSTIDTATTSPMAESTAMPAPEAAAQAEPTSVS